MKSGFLILIVFFFLPDIDGQETKILNAQRNYSGKISTAQERLLCEKAKGFPDNTQLSIVLIKNGKPSFFGFRLENDTLERLDNHHKVFEIGSITKVFTSTLLAQLVTENKVKLDDPVGNYLDVLLKDNQQITFRQLSNHTSGLPRMPSNLIITNPLNPYKGYGEANLRQYLSDKMVLQSKPSEQYAYSNLGSGLLGYLVGRIDKRSYDKSLQERIFGKYGMTVSTTDRQLIADRLVKGLGPEGAETPNWDFSVLAGCGGIYSSTDDLAKFALAQFDESDKAIALTHRKTFDINNNLGIGLGWHIVVTARGDEWLWHNGKTGGYTSSMVLDTARKTGVIILSNLSSFNKKAENIDALCFELMKTLN